MHLLGENMEGPSSGMFHELSAKNKLTLHLTIVKGKIKTKGNTFVYMYVQNVCSVNEISARGHILIV